MINIINPLYKDKQWLETNYKTKTARELANECNTNHQTILFWLRKYEIPRRHNNEARIRNNYYYPHVDYTKKYRNKKWLANEYKTKTVQQIADENQISKQALLKWFKKFNISRRTNGESHTLPTRVTYFNKINSSTKAYWLGFLMADGCNTGNRLQLHLSINDKEHLELFVNDIHWTGSIHTGSTEKNKKPHEWCHVGIGSQYLIQDIEKHGICKLKTGNESFPNINEKYYCDFIRGYFDGDGCYSYFYRLNDNKYNTLNSKIDIVCMNKDFLIAIKNILVKYCGIDENQIHIYDTNKIYSLQICSNAAILKFYNYIYPKYCRRYLKRKRNKFKETLDYIKSHN